MSSSVDSATRRSEMGGSPQYACWGFFGCAHAHLVWCAMMRVSVCGLFQIRCYNRLLQSTDIQSILNETVDRTGIMWRSFKAHWDEGQCRYEECKVCPYCLVLPAMSWLSKAANHLAMLQLEHQPGDPQEDLYHAQRDGNALAEKVAREALQRKQEGRGSGAIDGPDEKRERARQLAMLALGPDAEAVGGLYRGSPGSSLASATTVESCGKLKALRTLLRIWYRERRPRCKVLLFSNSTLALDLLEAMTLKAGYVHRRIDGQTPSKKRAQIVKEFHENDAIFLLMLSTRAGGVGLNLTCANIVVIFDPVRVAAICVLMLHCSHGAGGGGVQPVLRQSSHSSRIRLLLCWWAHQNWNPANDLQSQDRTYRIGQVGAQFGTRARSARRSVQLLCNLTSLCSLVAFVVVFRLSFIGEGRARVPLDLCGLHRGAGVSSPSVQAADGAGAAPSGDQTEAILQGRHENKTNAG